jgi:hypothetical protein
VRFIGYVDRITALEVSDDDAGHDKNLWVPQHCLMPVPLDFKDWIP